MDSTITVIAVARNWDLNSIFRSLNTFFCYGTINSGGRSFEALLNGGRLFDKRLFRLLLVFAIDLPAYGTDDQQDDQFLHELMAEMTGTGKDHGQTMLISGGNHFLVTHRATRLDDGLGTGRGQHVDAIAEREEGIRRDD